MSEKPEIDVPGGEAPTELVIDDIVVGTGAEAVPGATVLVHYVGVEFESGDEFDSSWNRGEPIEFPCGGSSPAGRRASPACRWAADVSSRSRRSWPTARPEAVTGSRARR